MFSEKQLASEYYTVERLKAEPRVQKFIAWIKKRPSTTYFG
jgi:hypothetical protein